MTPGSSRTAGAYVGDNLLQAQERVISQERLLDRTVDRPIQVPNERIVEKVRNHLLPYIPPGTTMSWQATPYPPVITSNTGYHLTPTGVFQVVERAKIVEKNMLTEQPVIQQVKHMLTHTQTRSCLALAQHAQLHQTSALHGRVHTLPWHHPTPTAWCVVLRYTLLPLGELWLRVDLFVDLYPSRTRHR